MTQKSKPDATATTASSTCCGQVCLTAFCPHCGKINKQRHLLAALREYCLAIGKQQRSRQERLEQELSAPAGIRSLAERAQVQRWIAAAQRNVAKWEQWADELDKVIQASLTSPP